MEFEVCVLLTSAIASQDKWVFITWKTKHTHAVVSQDAVRHLVTCPNKPWYFSPTETTFNIYKSKNRPSKIKSTRNLIHFHCSASPVTDCVYTTLFNHGQTQPPCCSGEGRTRHRLYPAKCPQGIKLLVHQTRKIQTWLREEPTRHNNRNSQGKEQNAPLGKGSRGILILKSLVMTTSLWEDRNDLISSLNFLQFMSGRFS